jgi:hypothetical protein
MENRRGIIQSNKNHKNYHADTGNTQFASSTEVYWVYDINWKLAIGLAGTTHNVTLLRRYGPGRLFASRNWLSGQGNVGARYKEDDPIFKYGCLRNILLT